MFENLNTSMLTRPALALVALIGLSACSSIGYRCPLDPNEKPDSPTACAGMSEALAGAKRGTGGKTSVLVDDQGRIVPPELLENRPVTPLAVKLASDAEPYRDATGQPVLHQPRVFRVWTASFVDENGNLHDGHHSWFATPSRWAYGTVNQPGLVGQPTMVPAMPGELPQGRILPPPTRGAQNHQVQVMTQEERDRAALQNLSNALNAQQPNAQTVAPAQSYPTFTAPSMGLAD